LKPMTLIITLWNAQETERALLSSGDNMQSNGREIQIPVFFIF